MPDRKLDDAESRLWRRVARHVSRRADAGDRRQAATPPDGKAADDKATDENVSMSDLLAEEDATATGRAPAERTPPRDRVPSGAADRPRAPARRSAPASPAAPAYGAGDPKSDRAVARRRQSIDRVIDLHGMTQEVAERAFVAFVTAAYHDGCRRLLVITGKGGPASQSNLTRRRLGVDDPELSADQHPAYPRRGVLRESVRAWVDAPELRPMIARLSSARPKDGGAGAYYLFLKPRSAPGRQPPKRR
ncbi:MAG: Smr/MutS family protein [Pseudomonadota bacterium]